MSVRVSQMGVSPPRFELPQPVTATLLDPDDATIIEVSLVGCSVHHATRVKPGASVSLQFVWEGKKARVEAKVARSTMKFTDGKPAFVSGLQFVETPDVIRKMVEGLTPAPEPEPAPAPAPEPPRVVAPPPPPPRPAPKEKPALLIYESVPFLRQDEPDDEPELEPIFLRCSLVNGKWERERVFDPAHPDEGFTILADTDDVDGICKTYEVADPETRKMMRFSFEIANEQQRA